MDNNHIMKYFKDKADRYDDVDEQIYWRLSDKLLWHFLQETVLKKFNTPFLFLDAGGGTGRWSIKILEQFDNASGFICDLSTDMLEQAKTKKNKLALGERLQLVNGNIQNMNQFNDKKFDVAFNFHNVLGFVDSPEDALKELARVTKSDGWVVSFVPNFYHCMFFNISVGSVDEAEYCYKHQKGRFTNDMPYMNLFTPQSITDLYERVDLKVEFISGFPSLIYPGYQETQLSGSTQGLMDILEQESSFDKIFDMEKSSSLHPGIAPRGNNLLVVGRKVV